MEGKKEGREEGRERGRKGRRKLRFREDSYSMSHQTFLERSRLPPS
jgi:hypothetical protein